MVRLVLALSCGLLAGLLPGEARSDPWALPPPDACRPSGGPLAPGRAEQDRSAAPVLQTGEVYGLDRIEALRDYLPEFLWAHRERFFHEGMRLEIGPCFRDYSPPAFFAEATRQGSGKARLHAEGALEGHVAGLPFAPDTIAAEAPDAGLRWLWNLEHRYQAGGFRAKFRMTDLLGRIGRAEPFEGEIFKILLSRRPDRAQQGYAVPFAKQVHWVAGGLFHKPFDAREYAWRQFRSLENEREAQRSDDLHAYLPQWRRVRRIAANQVEGLYMPSFSVGVASNQQLMVGGGAGGLGGTGGGVGAAGGVGGVGSTIVTKRSGWEGLELRPILHEARVVGLHDVIAPLDARSPMWPEQPDRDFGPWGLSFADDRWDLRRALVLELRTKKPGGADETARQILYADLQTLQPLFVASFDARDEMTNVGIYSGRWSEDRADYPRWPDDPERPLRVIDSVGAAFANLAEAGSWRRESWHAVSTPPDDRALRRLVSVGELSKRR